MTHLPFEINWTYIVGAFLLSLPGYLTWWSTRNETIRARKLAEQNAMKLEVVHTLVNSQSEKLNIAIQGKAEAEGQLKGRADAAAEQQAAMAIATPQDKEMK
jgi:hypothetical protein